MQQVFLDCYQKSIEISIKLAPTHKQTVDFYFYVPNDLGLKKSDYQSSDFFKNLSSTMFYHVSDSSMDIFEKFATQPITKQNIALYLKAFKFHIRASLNEATPQTIRKQIQIADNILEISRSQIESDPALTKTLKFMDEVNTHYYLQSILNYLKTYPDDQLAFTKANLLIEHRSQYQFERDKATDLSNIKRKEAFLSNSITLGETRKKLGLFREQFVYSIATSISMLISTYLIYQIQQHGAKNLSISFILASFLSFIFRDRVKEFFRVKMLNPLNKGKPQFKTLLTDSEKTQLGDTYEMMQFDTPPEKVNELRYLGKTTKQERLRLEEIIHFRKTYHLKSKGFSKEFNVIRELFFFHVDDIIRNAPNQHTKYLSLLKDGEIEEDFLQIFHNLNLIICIDEQMFRYRIKINYDGIGSFESVNIDNK